MEPKTNRSPESVVREIKRKTRRKLKLFFNFCWTIWYFLLISRFGAVKNVRTCVRRVDFEKCCKDDYLFAKIGFN